MRKIFPILDWLPQYKKSNWKGDLFAGLTVGVMLIPQGLAYAMIAGLPPIYGLYAALVPLLLYPIFGTGRQVAIGPAATMSLLVVAGVGTLAELGSDTYIVLAIALAFLVGIIQLAMGVFRLGFLVNFLSRPVITGFISAAALIIGASQLKHLLGIALPNSNYVHQIVADALLQLNATNLPTLLLGVGGILIILLVKHFKLPIPAPLLVVVLGILIVWKLELSNVGVQIVGTVPSGLPHFEMPTLDLATLKTLLPIALTIAFISFMESVAIAKTMQAKHKDYEVSANQELIALGLSKIGGAFFQAYPTTAGLSRTAVNDQAGAKTGLASIFSAALIGLTLLFLTPLFFYLPKAVLASIILVAVYKLVNIKEAKYLWHTHRTDFWMMIATFLGTLLLGIEEGIAIGALLSLGVVIYQTSKPDIIELGKIPDLAVYRNINRFDDVQERKDLLILRFDARLYYANADHFKTTILSYIEQKGEGLKALLLNADSINSVDSSGIHAIKAVLDYCQARDIEFYMTGVKGVVRDTFRKAGLFQQIGEDHFTLRIQHAVNHFDQEEYQTFKKYALQSN